VLMFSGIFSALFLGLIYAVRFQRRYGRWSATSARPEEAPAASRWGPAASPRPSSAGG
jgi:hypothetical protein